MNKYLILLGLVLVSACATVKGEDEHDELEAERANLKYVVTNEVYLDITIKESKEGATVKTGRIVVGLFGDIVPMTATNFIQIAKGFKREGVSKIFISQSLMIL